MMMSGGNNDGINSSSSNFSRYPFTPTQWQELEQQALIYRYMASGIPVPSDLLLPIKRSFLLNSTQPTMGWSCFQMGYGRKAEDPEPGRCRRTDGKKWRCSKEAYPDSKYCERHMHRGKNRSRKPVEISLSPNTNTNNTNSTSNTTTNSSSSSDPPYPYPLFYPHTYSSPADSSWELRPPGLGEPKQREEDKHCFVLGADFKQETMRPVKERDFFDIGWPQKSKGGSWMGLDVDHHHNSSSQGSSSSCSKTQLSISIPMGLHDFPQWLVS